MVGGFKKKPRHKYEILGFLKTKGFKTKRILVFGSSSNSHVTPVNTSSSESNESLLESLSRDILITILCLVDEDDLSSLELVSTTIRRVVAEAKEFRSDNRTPRRRLPFRDSLLNLEEDDEMEPPGAPIRKRKFKRNLDLRNISRVLFRDEDEDLR